MSTVKSAVVNFVATITEDKFDPKRGMSSQRQASYVDDAVAHAFAALPSGCGLDVVDPILARSLWLLVERSSYQTWPSIGEIVAAIRDASDAVSADSGASGRDPSEYDIRFKRWAADMIVAGSVPPTVYWDVGFARALLQGELIGAVDLERLGWLTRARRHDLGIPEPVVDDDDMRRVGEVLTRIDEAIRQKRPRLLKDEEFMGMAEGEK